MNVAILHFHLRRGGVSSVMHKQVASLAMIPNPPQVIFLSGTPSDLPTSLPVFVVPELDYDSFTHRDRHDRVEEASHLARILQETLAVAFPSGCDLLHVHNPLLCKNASLVGAVRLLQKKGQALLVQIHDVAEDFRPEVYDSFWSYPENCDYATINRRDRNHLIAAGLDPRHVHFLPNPVTPSEDFEAREGFERESPRGRASALYPVRAIRRKNIGETLFLSQFLPEGAEIVVTLPPTSPSDQGRYTAWKKQASDWGLPVRFEAGSHQALSELYDRSFCVLTTSVKEGFGYSYLDPLIRGLPVVGRNLPAVIDDFTDAGLTFEQLYPSIRIPRNAMEESQLETVRNQIVTKLREGYSTAFGEDQERKDAIFSQLSGRFKGEFLDFGALDESLQMIVLDRQLRDTGFCARLVEENPFLATLFENAPTKTDALRQRETILQCYSEAEYGKQLMDAYEVAAGGKARGKIDKAIFAEKYLIPSSLFGVAS